MTPKQKADELIDNIGVYAKYCVEEILLAFEEVEGQSPNIYEQIEYWKNVQKELIF